MVSKTALLLAAFIFSSWAKKTKRDCKARVYDHYNLSGKKRDFRMGEYRKLGSWNDRIEAVEVSGGSGCFAVVCQHTDFKGHCLRINDDEGYRYPPGSQIHRQLSSIIVSHTSYIKDRRRTGGAEDLETQFPEAEVYTFDEPEEDVYDPLCEAVFNEFLESEGQMFANSTIKSYELKTILSTCEASFTTQEEVDQCKFYTHAGLEILDDETILDSLRIDDSTVTDKLEEYQRCGLLNGKINSFVESGKFTGVEIVEIDGEEFFDLDASVDDLSVDLVPNSSGQLEAVISAGSLLAMWIGTTLVKVCRDFDAQTGAWLLA